jgi:hypothetical protein
MNNAIRHLLYLQTGSLIPKITEIFFQPQFLRTFIAVQIQPSPDARVTAEAEAW